MSVLLLENRDCDVDDSRLEHHDAVELVSTLHNRCASVVSPRSHQADDVLDDLIAHILEE